ncbi:hypothetical protein CJF30_00001283 [Rutstroemia sp. NJR-2017a BBW]|nr:hypothetical protein CJF30_00001283 [Rutstroemia sp. NJR-2017a BBW]
MHRRFAMALGILVSLWTLTACVACAFQCYPPHVWAIGSNKCFDQVRVLLQK